MTRTKILALAVLAVVSTLGVQEAYAQAVLPFDLQAQIDRLKQAFKNLTGQVNDIKTDLNQTQVDVLQNKLDIQKNREAIIFNSEEINHNTNLIIENEVDIIGLGQQLSQVDEKFTKIATYSITVAPGFLQTIPASLAGTPVTITETCPTTDFTPSFMGYDVNRIGLQASGSDKLDFQITDLRVFRNTNQVGGSFEIVASDPSGQGTGSLEVRPILECTQIVLTN